MRFEKAVDVVVRCEGWEWMRKVSMDRCGWIDGWKKQVGKERWAGEWTYTRWRKAVIAGLAPSMLGASDVKYRTRAAVHASDEGKLGRKMELITRLVVWAF